MSRKRVLTSPAAAWVAAALGAWLVAGACRSVQHRAPAAGPLPSPSAEGLVETPAVRVGILPRVSHVAVAAPSGVRVLAGRLQPRWRPLPQATFVPTDAEGRVRLLETGEELARATVVPADPREIVSADARPYRGIVEVRPAEGGTLTVVNVVHVEDYLRGVVANELSPKAFPQIEAHKAQAVAARTWVLAHLGDYASEGYDVCATAACQVYRGQASEQPLTDEAVALTRGVIATWRGRPIHAYYTSTCGGHTEDGDLIFDDRAPYLRGVVCAPEGTARHTLRTTAAPRKSLSRDAGGPRNLAVLEALGVLDRALVDDAEKLRGVPGDDEIRGWMTRLQGAARRSGCPSPVTGGLARRGSFFEYGVASVCWRERAARLLRQGDPAALLAIEDAEELSADGERQAAALLLHEGLVSPGPGNTLAPGGTLSRAEIADVLAGLAEATGAPEWRSGEVVGFADGELTLLQGEDAESFPVDPAARLFRGHGGLHAGVRDLTLGAGDEVSYVARGGRIVYLEAHQTGREAAGARSASRHYRWETRLTPEDVARRVARYGSVGQVQDLVPRKLGVSGRVVELEVQGTTGDLLLKGLRVRWGLGLRENLFVIDRETDDSGGVGHFNFTGKGWGHGVGLCQVGAFGMAQAGATFERILKHYYTGVQLSVPSPARLSATPVSLASRDASRDRL